MVQIFGKFICRGARTPYYIEVIFAAIFAKVVHSEYVLYSHKEAEGC